MVDKSNESVSMLDDLPLGAEMESLALLSEECGELIQAIGKCLRFGLRSHHSSNLISNRAMIEEEAGQVIASIEIAVRELGLDEANIAAARQRKLDKLRQYVRYIRLM